jgi:hypothetical protein
MQLISQNGDIVNYIRLLRGKLFCHDQRLSLGIVNDDEVGYIVSDLPRTCGRSSYHECAKPCCCRTKRPEGTDFNDFGTAGPKETEHHDAEGPNEH